MSLTLTARWIAPRGGVLLPHGLLTIEGERIVAVEAAGARRADVDLGASLLVPGLVNAHTHLDLTGMAGLAPPSADFPGWLRQVIAHRRQRTPEQIQSDIHAGIDACLQTGTTLVGDISGDGSSWELLTASPLRAVVFRELLGLPVDRAESALRGAQEWLDSRPPSVRCRAGLSPHAPYSVRAGLFEEAARLAARHGCPLAVHLAETVSELDLLRERKGAFVPFLQAVGVWDPQGLAGSPAEVIQRCTAARPRLFIHSNYLSEEEEIPADSTLVYCPRTHAAFGHAAHPWRQWLARGHRVALGTDSLASNPDLDLLAEVRWLRRSAPEVPTAVLLHLATLAGAQALGLGEQTGSLEAGKFADFLVVPLRDADTMDPLTDWLDGEAGPRAVVLSGACVVGALSGRG